MTIREKFETWYAEGYTPKIRAEVLEKYANDYYKDSGVEDAWEVWQAAWWKAKEDK